MTELLKQIKNEVKSFEETSIEIVPGFSFNQKQTLNRIYLYYNSRFESGDIDEQGDKKYFYNITRNPCHVSTKAIDFDTKDIQILTAEGGNPWITWLYSRDLKFWMKDQGFGQVLNRLFYELPIYGSVVLKVINGRLYFVDLRNFVVDQTADSLDQANYIIEIHNYTPVEFRRIGKLKGWDESVVQQVIDAYHQSSRPYIVVYERYGEVEENGEYRYKQVVIAETQESNTNEADGIVLAEEEVETHPYKEFHWEKLPGRWLGVGTVESLFDPQIRVNEITNQQVKSSYWSTLRIWQTQSESINKNLLTDVANGDILFVDSPIMQVDMADRNLAFYNQEIQRWLTNRDELTMAYDVIRGERLPAGTPLGSAQLAYAMASSYFDQVRENIAMGIKDLLYTVVLPQFERENSQEHILRITGDNLEELNNFIIDQLTHQEILKFIARNLTLPTQLQQDLIKGAITNRWKKGKERLIRIPQDFYRDIKYKIDIEITGEAIDVRIRSANKWMALQAITADPTLLTDPTKRKFFASWLEDGGLHLMDFDVTPPPTLETAISQALQRAGGGISKPVLPSTPIMGATNEEIPS